MPTPERSAHLPMALLYVAGRFCASATTFFQRLDPHLRLSRVQTLKVTRRNKRGNNIIFFILHLFLFLSIPLFLASFLCLCHNLFIERLNPHLRLERFQTFLVLCDLRLHARHGRLDLLKPEGGREGGRARGCERSMKHDRSPP